MQGTTQTHGHTIILTHSSQKLELTLPTSSFNVEVLRFAQSLESFPFDALDEFVTGRNVMDETNDLASGPYLQLLDD